MVHVFDRVDPATVQSGARHSRGNPWWPRVGIFAQRGKGRPNRIGVTVCRLLAVDGPTLTVRALDAIDGTPVLDVTPYLAEFAPPGRGAATRLVARADVRLLGLMCPAAGAVAPR